MGFEPFKPLLNRVRGGLRSFFLLRLLWFFRRQRVFGQVAGFSLHGHGSLLSRGRPARAGNRKGPGLSGAFWLSER